MGQARYLGKLLIQKGVSMKPGYKSTEFWMNLVAMVLTTSGIGVDPEAVGSIQTYLPVMISAVYTIGRSIVKAFGGSA